MLAVVSQAQANERNGNSGKCFIPDGSANCPGTAPVPTNVAPPIGVPQPPPFHPPGVHIGGGPYWVGDDYGYGWRHRHHPNVYFNFEVGPSYNDYGYRCSDIASSLRDSGYRRVRALVCGGKNFVYSAYRDGERLRLTISSRSGRILNIRPLY